MPILVVDDNREVLTALRLLLKDQDDAVHTATDPAALPALVERTTYDVALLDMNFTQGASDGAEGFQWLERLRTLSPETVVIMMTAYGDVDKAVAAMKAGAADFIVKPWSNERLVQSVQAAIRVRKTRQQQPALLPEPAAEPFAIIGESPAMQAVFATLDKVAATDANVLVLGEHGTGKELIARRLHARSHRADGPFVSVDLGAVTASLFESELFGHTKGAFTGADHDRQGPFEAASGGTLFLDEIGNIPLELQNKLLTVLERRAVTRVGSLDARPVEVRLVCATNRPIYDLAGGVYRREIIRQ
ncbi:MAG: sigma-54 dependent transcriptional regulator [Bacteroidota bacterium]